MCSVRCSVRTFGGKFERRHAAIDLRQVARSKEGRSLGLSSMKPGNDYIFSSQSSPPHQGLVGNLL